MAGEGTMEVRFLLDTQAVVTFIRRPTILGELTERIKKKKGRNDLDIDIKPTINTTFGDNKLRPFPLKSKAR